MYRSYNNRNRNRSSKAMIIIFALTFGVMIYSIKSFFFDEMAIASGNSMNKEQVESIVKEYLQNNPELIASSLKMAHEKTMKEAEEKAKIAISSRKKEIENTKTSPFEGNNDGDITIVEFFDYRCGYCKTANKTVNQLMAEDKNIKVIFKQYPILGEDSYLAAKSALAIYEMEPKKYISFHNKLMEIKQINKEAINNLVKELGFDFALFEQTLAKKSIEEELSKIRDLAKDININGTPAFIINGELVPGALDLDNFKVKIAGIRKDKTK
jgi:protein-disulfide isomerase